MKLGFTSMNTPDEIRTDVLAKALEERGFDSFWVGEHSHIPSSRATPYPAGGEMPDQYKEMMDPYIGLMAAAAATDTIRLGTAIALTLERDVITMAKTVATLDYFSGGRVEIGVGVGWNEEELANHSDIKWRQRYRALEECVAALRTLWTDEESEFHGEFYDFDPLWSLPKPVQNPHPPILCGMGGKLGTKHAIRWADAWMPMDVALGNVSKKLALFREATKEAGRDELPISMVTFGDPTLETLQHYRELGVQRVIVGGDRDGWDDSSRTMSYIDRYAEMVPLLDDK